MKDYIYEVGEIISVRTGEIKILEKIRVDNGKSGTRKGYKYVCLKDGYIDENSESEIKRGTGCKVCNNRVIVKGINDIGTTHPHLIKYFYDKNDSYIYSYGKNVSVKLKCPDCGNVKYMTINDLSNKGFSCQCKDGYASYPEKVVYSILYQLELKFKHQLTKTKFEWCGKYRYDFYLPEYNMIIETHGMQHYEEQSEKSRFSKTLSKQMKTDKEKENLAKENNIENYIILDCRYSNLQWVKNSVLNSKLNQFFDLSIINWNECESFALKNIAKEICNYWGNKEDWESVGTISSLFDVDRTVVSDYLKKGTELGWCNYDAKDEMKKSGKNRGRENGKKSSKKVKVENFDTGSIKIYPSAKEVERCSRDIFGYFVSQGSISRICNGKKIYKDKYRIEYV